MSAHTDGENARKDSQSKRRNKSPFLSIAFSSSDESYDRSFSREQQRDDARDGNPDRSANSFAEKSYVGDDPVNMSYTMHIGDQDKSQSVCEPKHEYDIPNLHLVDVSTGKITELNGKLILGKFSLDCRVTFYNN